MCKGGWLLSSLMMMRMRCVDSLLAVDSSYVMAGQDRKIENSWVTLKTQQVASSSFKEHYSSNTVESFRHISNID